MSELQPWRANLILTGTGAPKPLLANAITALREAPAWQGVLAYDQFALETVVNDAPPWHIGLQWIARAWSSHDDLLAAEWFQRNGISVNVATAAQAVEAVARDRSFHPVIGYLSNLRHDGVARSGTWLSICLGAEPNRYNESVGRAMLIAATGEKVTKATLIAVEIVRKNPVRLASLLTAALGRRAALRRAQSEAIAPSRLSEARWRGLLGLGVGPLGNRMK
jgi:hypothetical protein